MQIELVDLNESPAILKKIAERHYSKQTLQELSDYWIRALSWENPVFTFVDAQAFAHTSPEGEAHLVASRDNRLPDLGFIGFFESDPINSTPLLKEAVNWLREHGAKRIMGPFDMTIMQRYRFNHADDQIFHGEPVNLKHYEKEFEQVGFLSFNQYVSGIRSDFSTILPYTDPKGEWGEFSLRKFNPEHFEDELGLVHHLSVSAFTDTSEYFVKFSLKEFLYWYNPLKNVIDPRYTEFLYHRDTPIGFSYSFVQNNILIMKSLAVLPKYQGEGASKYLIFSQHSKAQEDELEAAIYALVRVGNNVAKMPYPGVEIFRNYSSMVNS